MKFILVLVFFLCSFNSKAAFSFLDGFESGDTSAWSNIVPRSVSKRGCSSSLSVINTMAMSGNFFLEAVICDTPPLAFVEDTSPNNESSFRAMFDFNPNSATLPMGSEVVIFQARSSTPNNSVLELSLFNNAGNLEIRAYGFNDAGVSAGFIPIQLPDLNTHRIGVGFTAATGDGNNDGVLELELDQVPAMSSINNLDNDTLGVDSARLGIIRSTGSSGSIYFDQYSSDHDSLPVSLMYLEID